MADLSRPIRSSRKLVRLPNVELDDVCVHQRQVTRCSYSEFRHKTSFDLTATSSEQSNRLPPIFENNDEIIKPILRRGSENVSRSRFGQQFSMRSKDENALILSPNFIFDPDGHVVFYWTCLTSLAVLYNYWIIILRVAFREIHEQDLVGYLDSVCDVIYLSDITIQLRTGYLMDGIPIFDPVKLRQHYTRQTVFVRDIASILPFSTILRIFPENVIFSKCTGTIIGLARVNRLLKLHTLYKFYDLADSRTGNPNWIRAFRLSLALAVVIHWIGCLYYVISEYEGLGVNNWVYTSHASKQRFYRKYIVCLYWSAMTLTTIGESNPPETDVEYIFTGLTYLVGVCIFATVVGNVGDVIANINAARQEFQSKMDQIKIYLTHKKVPPSLQIKVKKWAEYSWSRTQATDESRLLNMLPERLRAEIAVHVHLDTLKKVKIFEQCEHGFLCELVLKLKSQIYSPGDYICKAGETGREMYIINHGKVEVVVASCSNGNELVVAVLSEGNYFGEISLLRLDGVQNRRTADVRSIGYSELLCLSRKDLMAALVEYPEAKTILESQARERIKTNMQAKRTFSVDAFLESTEEQDRSGSRYGRDDKRRESSDVRSFMEEIRQFQFSVTSRRVNDLTEKCNQLRSELLEKQSEAREAKSLINKLKWTIRHQRRLRPSVVSHKRVRRKVKTLAKRVREVSLTQLSSEGKETSGDCCFQEGADVGNGLPKIIVDDDSILLDPCDIYDPLRLCTVERYRRCSSLTSLSETSNSRRSSYQSSCSTDPED